MGPPCLCPQGGQAARLQEECDYVQMIEVQHKQCLEEGQLENETTGEAPMGRGGAACPQGVHDSSCLELRSKSRSFHICWMMVRSGWGARWKKKGANRLPHSHPRSGELPAAAEEDILNRGSEKYVEPTLPLGVPIPLLQEK